MVSPHAGGGGGTPALGIVIPALDEAETLPGLLSDLSRLTLEHIVMVVDGGSRDATVSVARARGAHVMRGRRGRARQMNAGARWVAGRWLLFLHADSRLGKPALQAIEAHVREDGPMAAHFGLSISHEHFFYRFIERGQRIRERRLGLVYGDQGLLIRRDLLFTLGPYPDEPLMEDVTLNRRLLLAGRLLRLPAAVATSPRRYEEEGRIRGWLRNVRLITRFLAGAAPSALAARYPPRRSLGRDRDPGAPRPGDPQATLLVFAKAPRPGTVKTRLARELGHEAAAAVYRRMGRLIVDRVAPAPAALTICYDPGGAEAEVREWLGSAPRRYWHQGDGDLGARMSRMFRRGFERSSRVVVIGTDTPAVTSRTITRAIEALDSADVVLGPASDGGYYLMALGEPRPELFTGIRWSTESVLAETLSRCAELGLSVTHLEVESDIDTAEDLAAEVAGRPDLGEALSPDGAPSRASVPGR